VVPVVVLIVVALIGAMVWIVLCHFGVDGLGLVLLFWYKPNDESFVHSHARFLISGGRIGERLTD
jgi:hypothetical protein